MGNTTDHEEEQRSTDPARFAGMLRHAPREGRRTGELIGSALALFALVIGLPALLLVLSGPPPFPTGAPSLRDLAQQLSFEDLLSVLVAIVWLAWAYFIVCVFVEVIAARRGGMAKSVPLAGPLQKLAQVLVGALLMSGLMAGNAQAAVDIAGASSSVSATSSVMWDVGGTATATSVAPAEASASDAAVAEVGVEAGQKIYSVTAPKDGYHDNLWDIAERHLGDGLRYKEIYELNKDHLQPDGRKLELARLIQPGWNLVMPDDATGIAPIQAPAPSPTSLGASDSVETGTSADAPVQAEATIVQSDSSGTWMVGAGLLAAGVIGALALQRRRQLGRRPDDDALDAESEFRISASLARSSWLDRALRELALASRRQGTTPPSAYAALLDDDSVELLLAPAAPDALDGWIVLDEGRRWRCERASVSENSLANEVSPYPALVSLGVDDEGRDVLLDLEAAGGVVSIMGDPVVAGEVAAAIVVQSATTPWSDAVRIVASNLPEGIAQVGNDRIRVVDDLSAELATFEEQIGGLRENVLTGRMRRRGTIPSYLVVCGTKPELDVAERLGTLAGAGRQAFSVVVAGEHKAARWRMRVDEHGALSIPQLDLAVIANRISPKQVEAVEELFASTREPDHPDDGDRVRIPQPLHSHDDAAWTTASRRVGVLGRVTVQGAGQLPADRADLATEMVTFLALHPEGVHPNVLAAALWPRGVTADVRDATIDRARLWLGSDVDGSHFLRSDGLLAGGDGRLSLADSVVCDWDCARTLFIDARRADSKQAEIDLLRRALKMVRGEAFDSVPEGHYGWIVRDDVTRTMVRVVIDGAHRLSHMLNDEDDPNGAAQAAESGLRINPGSQLLWRELMRARYSVSGVAGVRQTLDSMSESLQSIPLEPETEALIEEFLPDTGSIAAGS